MAVRQQRIPHLKPRVGRCLLATEVVWMAGRVSRQARDVLLVGTHSCPVESGKETGKQGPAIHQWSLRRLDRT